MVIMRAFCKFLIKFDRKIKLKMFLYLTGESRLRRVKAFNLFPFSSSSVVGRREGGRDVWPA